jgi:hypothetical protein
MVDGVIGFDGYDLLVGENILDDELSENFGHLFLLL